PIGNLTTHRQASLSGTRCIYTLHKIRDAVRGLIAIMPPYVCLVGCNVLSQTCASLTPDSGFSRYELPWKFRLKGAKGVGYKLADHGGNSRNPNEAEIELSLMYPSWMGYKRCRWRIHDRGRPSSR
ncbi:hypothetical protein ALC62_15770, partial [Cyphomyrmex costatus]